MTEESKKTGHLKKELAEIMKKEPDGIVNEILKDADVEGTIESILSEIDTRKKKTRTNKKYPNLVGGGRNSILNEYLLTRIKKFALKGLPNCEICRQCKIASSTFDDWLKLARRSLLNLHNGVMRVDDITPHEYNRLVLFQLLQKRDTIHEADLVKVIDDKAKVDKDLRAAIYLLEQSFPTKYGRKIGEAAQTNVKVSTSEGKVESVDITTQFDIKRIEEYTEEVRNFF